MKHLCLVHAEESAPAGFCDAARAPAGRPARRPR